MPAMLAKHSGLALAGVHLWARDYRRCSGPVFLCESERLGL